MRILGVDAEAIDRIEYMGPSLQRRAEHQVLEVATARVDALPAGIKALVAAADLQGRAADGRLLGEAVAHRLAALSQTGSLPPGEQTLTLLAGDFYCRPGAARRGGSGDVRPVWEAFRAWSQTVVGVAGNHDVFSDQPSEPALRAFRSLRGMHLLDGDVVHVAGLRIGGVSGVVGRPGRPWRRAESDLIDSVNRILQPVPDVLLMHEGPGSDSGEQAGLPTLLPVLSPIERSMLVIRGHKYWPDPLLTLSPHCQVLNVDSRVLVLRSS